MGYEWYLDFPITFIETMLIISSFPWIEFLAFYSIKKLKIFWDKGLKCKSNSTKCLTYKQYVDLYSGPEY